MEGAGTGAAVPSLPRSRGRRCPRARLHKTTAEEIQSEARKCLLTGHSGSGSTVEGTEMNVIS